MCTHYTWFCGGVLRSNQIFFLFREAVMLLFYTVHRIGATKVVCVSKICYHHNRTLPMLSGASGAPASHVRASVMLVLPIVGN
jgi:hypothetical protein